MPLDQRNIIPRALKVLAWFALLWVLSLGAVYAEPAKEDKQTVAPQAEYTRRIEAPFKAVEGLQSQIKQLEQKKLEVEKAVERAKDDPEVKKRREAIAKLESELNALKARLRQHKASSGLGGVVYYVIGSWAPIGVLSLVLSLALFFLICAYLLWFKKPLTFRHEWADMRTSFYRLVMPHPRVAQAGSSKFLRWACLVLGLLAVMLGVVLLSTGAAWAREDQGGTNIPLWQPNKLSFGESVENLNQLMESDSWGRVTFVLEHPQYKWINQHQYSQFLSKNLRPMKLEKAPALDFTERRFPCNSYEHLFLLARVEYERGILDKSLRYFSWTKDIEGHPFYNPPRAQIYLLNQLKILLEQKKEEAYQDLFKMFLEHAEPTLRYDLVRFITTRIDAARGLKLFESLIHKYPHLGLDFLEQLFADRGPEGMAPFWGAYITQVKTRAIPISPAIELLMRAYGACDPQKQAGLRAMYLEGVKKILEQNVDIRIKFPAYKFLLSAGEKAFLVQRLKADLQADGGGITLDTYLQVVGLLYHSDATDVANTYLEQAYKKHYTSVGSLGKILLFCLEQNLLPQASQVLAKAQEQQPGMGDKPIGRAFVQRLPLVLPVYSQGISVRGFDALLHYQLKNYQSCRQLLEESLKKAIATALAKYDPNPKLNLNEFYYLLLACQKLEDWKQVGNLLPLFERSAKGVFNPAYMQGLRERISELREQIANLQKTKEAASLSPEQATRRMEEIRGRISDVKWSLRWQEIRNSLHHIARALIIAMIVLWWLVVGWYSLCRGAHFALRDNRWKLTVFVAAVWESFGFALIMTVLFAVPGFILVMASQVVLRFMGIDKLACAPVPAVEPAPVAHATEEVSA